MSRAVLLALLGALVFVTVVAARLPVGLVLAQLPPEITYRSASGTVWQGRAAQIEVGEQSLGEGQLALRFLPLITGNIAADIDLRGQGLSAAGRFGAAGEVLSASNVEAQAGLARFGLTDFFGAPLRGSIDIDIERITYGTSGCMVADFAVSTDALAQSLGGYGSESLILSGQGYCEEGVLVLPLRASAPEGDIDARLSLAPGGRWTSSLSLAPTDERLGMFLSRQGFERDADGAWSMERSGMLAELL